MKPCEVCDGYTKWDPKSCVVHVAEWNEKAARERKKTVIEKIATVMRTEEYDMAVNGPDAEGKVAYEQSTLGDWWIEQAEKEVSACVEKNNEYGKSDGVALDLVDIGSQILRLAGREVWTDKEAVEVGIAFYIQGKISRWMSAIQDGRRVSDDTLWDISVYTKMAQRNRTPGGWPGRT